MHYLKSDISTKTLLFHTILLIIHKMLLIHTRRANIALLFSMLYTSEQREHTNKLVVRACTK